MFVLGQLASLLFFSNSAVAYNTILQKQRLDRMDRDIAQLQNDVNALGRQAKLCDQGKAGVDSAKKVGNFSSYEKKINKDKIPPNLARAQYVQELGKISVGPRSGNRMAAFYQMRDVLGGVVATKCPDVKPVVPPPNPNPNPDPAPVKPLELAPQFLKMLLAHDAAEPEFKKYYSLSGVFKNKWESLNNPGGKTLAEAQQLSPAAFKSFIGTHVADKAVRAALWVQFNDLRNSDKAVIQPRKEQFLEWFKTREQIIEAGKKAKSAFNFESDRFLKGRQVWITDFILTHQSKNDTSLAKCKRTAIDQMFSATRVFENNQWVYKPRTVQEQRSDLVIDCYVQQLTVNNIKLKSAPRVAGNDALIDFVALEKLLKAANPPILETDLAHFVDQTMIPSLDIKDEADRVKFDDPFKESQLKVNQLREFYQTVAKLPGYKSAIQYASRQPSFEEKMRNSSNGAWKNKISQLMPAEFFQDPKVAALQIKPGDAHPLNPTVATRTKAYEASLVAKGITPPKLPGTGGNPTSPPGANPSPPPKQCFSLIHDGKAHPHPDGCQTTKIISVSCESLTLDQCKSLADSATGYSLDAQPLCFDARGGADAFATVANANPTDACSQIQTEYALASRDLSELQSDFYTERDDFDFQMNNCASCRDLLTNFEAMQPMDGQSTFMETAEGIAKIFEAATPASIVAMQTIAVADNLRTRRSEIDGKVKSYVEHLQYCNTQGLKDCGSPDQFFGTSNGLAGANNMWAYNPGFLSMSSMLGSNVFNPLGGGVTPYSGNYLGMNTGLWSAYNQYRVSAGLGGLPVNPNCTFLNPLGC